MPKMSLYWSLTHSKYKSLRILQRPLRFYVIVGLIISAHVLLDLDTWARQLCQQAPYLSFTRLGQRDKVPKMLHYYKEAKPILLLSQSKECKKFLKQLNSIIVNSSLGFITTSNLFDNLAPLTHKLTRSEAPLFIALDKNICTIGRTYNNELIDIIEFSLDDFTDLIDYELNARYFLVFVNIENKKIENLFTDIFGYKGKEIAINEVKNILIIQKVDEKYNFTLKKEEKIIFAFSLALKRVWHCEEDVFDKACGVTKKKKQKNINRNEMGDVIGKLHMEKQDLKEIQIKKARKVKNIN